MTRIVLIISVAFGTSFHLFAQERAVWRGLVLEESTIEKTVDVLGNPKKRKVEDLTRLSSRSRKAKGKTVVESIVYEKIDGWEKVVLSFSEAKLFRVKFWPRNKTILASTLPETYEAGFVSVEGFSDNVALSVFDGQKEPTVPRVYPAIYFMVSSKPDQFIIATINNGSWAALWNDAAKRPTVKTFPGHVEDIEILSRKAEVD